MADAVVLTILHYVQIIHENQIKSKNLVVYTGGGVKRRDMYGSRQGMDKVVYNKQ